MICLSVISLVCIACLPIELTQGRRFQASYSRGPNFEKWTSANGRVTWVSASQAVYDGDSWVDYIFEDHYALQGKYVVQTGLIAVEIFDYYIKIFDPNMTEVRVYDERWEIQQWKSHGSGRWDNIGAESGRPIFHVETFSDGVNITKSFYSWAGWLNITYTFQGPLKHTVMWQNQMGTTETFRVLQQWSGIVGGKCRHEKGSINILSATEINGSQFMFMKDNNELSVFENQWSAKEFLNPVVVDTHAQGMKCDFTFSNWTLPDGGTLTIDPTTTTISSPEKDAYVSEYYADNNAGSSTTLTVSGWGLDTRRSFIVFDISSLPSGSTISSAIFGIYSYSNLAGHNRVDIHGVSDTSWSEAELTWNNQPAYNVTIQDYLTPTDATWHNFTVTSWANGRAGGLVGFLLKMNNEEPNDGTHFYSKEKGSYDPKLYLTYTPAPTISGFAGPTTAYSDVEFILNCTVNHIEGVAFFDYVTLEIDSSVVLKWDNTTNVFSENGDPSNLCFVNAGSSVRTSVNASAYTLSWAITLTANFPKGGVSVYETNTTAWDSYGQSGTGSESNVFMFESTTQEGGSELEDFIDEPEPKIDTDLPETPKIVIPTWGYYALGGAFGLVAIGIILKSPSPKRRRPKGVKANHKRSKRKELKGRSKTTGRFR